MPKHRPIRLLAQAAALCAGLLFAGCFSVFKPDLKQQVNELCGDPMKYPLSDQCVAVFGKYGPLMRRKSDLIVAESSLRAHGIRERGVEGLHRSNGLQQPTLRSSGEGKCRWCTRGSKRSGHEALRRGHGQKSPLPIASR